MSLNFRVLVISFQIVSSLWLLSERFFNGIFLKDGLRAGHATVTCNSPIPSPFTFNRVRCAVCTFLLNGKYSEVTVMSENVRSKVPAAVKS